MNVGIIINIWYYHNNIIVIDTENKITKKYITYSETSKLVNQFSCGTSTLVI